MGSESCINPDDKLETKSDVLLWRSYSSSLLQDTIVANGITHVLGALWVM